MRPLLVIALCAAGLARGQSVLERLAPLRAEGVSQPHRLTDGQTPYDGDAWDGPAAALLNPGARVEWDLGAPTHLEAAALQADNNDEYLLSWSLDGVSWQPLWSSGTANAPGLQTRATEALDVTARYLQLTASGGDGRYSVSELEVLRSKRDESVLTRSRWVPRHPLERTFTTWLLFCCALLLVASRRLPRRFVVLLGLAGLGATAYVVFEVTPSTPGAPNQLPWVRATVALLAAFAVLRERLWPARWPADERAVLGALGVTGALGLWCFLNLGTPQFHDAGARRLTWLHHYDMRTYYPIARYFPELRFDGVYAASVLAVAEERGGLSALQHVGLRDLRTHQGTTVGQSMAHLEAVRARFSPARWALFLDDMRYFRTAMGEGAFLGSMNDHGGNATPVWFLAAWALFHDAKASDATLWRGVVADVLLVLLAFAALGWAWGARTAFLAMTVFGAMDFYQFGSNWFGATLRHDWLALWALGLALLQKRHRVLAGAAFAWSAWIRAFPALTFVTLSLPVLWGAGRLLLRRNFTHAWRQARPLVLVAAGVVVASVVLVGASIALFGADAWTEWLRKVQTLDKDNHLNNLSFRTYLSQDRRVWQATIAASLVGLAVVLRRAPLVRAAAWGVALVPVVFNPANYYLHATFLLVTLAAEHRQQGHAAVVDWRGTVTWLGLTLMCAASYWTTLSPSVATHFQLDTIVLFVALLLLFAVEATQRSSPSHA